MVDGSEAVVGKGDQVTVLQHIYRPLTASTYLMYSPVCFTASQSHSPGLEFIYWTLESAVDNQ